LVLSLAISLPAYAHGRVFFRGDVLIGPGWGPWWWGPPYYPYGPYYSEPPVVVPQQPPAYVEPSPQPEAQYYWYFCQKPEGYYPYVKKCPDGWLKVIPPVPQDEEE
jgi:hypothetical protein